MTQLHGNQNVSSDETIKDTVREIAKKRCRKSKPRISLKPIVTPKLHLEEMIKFYEDCSNSSELSLEFEAPLDVQDKEQLDEIAANVPPVDSGANQLVEDEIESDFNEFVDRSGSFLSDTDKAESSGLGFNEIFSRMRLREVNEVSAGNLIASLLAIVARHNCSDALLFDLIKRDQELFDHQTITPWAVKTMFSEFFSLYQDEKITLENGELIVVKFRQLLVDIVEEHIDEMLFYAANKTFNEDLHMPEFRIIGNKLTVRLIVNTDGANVSKSPVTLAWPLFISVADLPPRKRQSFQNIVLAALFVGSGYPDFNQIFQHMINELSSATFLKVGERKIELDFQPILFVADLIGKAKVLKMQQCNGFYGCTLSTQRGFHFAGSHRYPHDEKFVMRSHESHLLNLRELEKGSIREIQLKHGRKADAEVRTQGVKGRSILLSLIPNQPLSSPIDPMHQLFLGVAKTFSVIFTTT